MDHFNNRSHFFFKRSRISEVKQKKKSSETCESHVTVGNSCIVTGIKRSSESAVGHWLPEVYPSFSPYACSLLIPLLGHLRIRMGVMPSQSKGHDVRNMKQVTALETARLLAGITRYKYKDIYKRCKWPILPGIRIYITVSEMLHVGMVFKVETTKKIRESDLFPLLHTWGSCASSLYLKLDFQRESVF